MDDMIAIQQLLNTYTEAAGRADWDVVMGTFIEDGVWEIPNLGAFKGRAEIEPMMTGTVGMMDYFMQFNCPAVINVTNDTATARTVIRECGKFKDRLEMLEVMGSYSDDLVRTANGWKFARRLWKLTGMQRFPILPGKALG